MSPAGTDPESIGVRESGWMHDRVAKHEIVAGITDLRADACDAQSAD